MSFVSYMILEIKNYFLLAAEKFNMLKDSDVLCRFLNPLLRDSRL